MPLIYISSMIIYYAAKGSNKWHLTLRVFGGVHSGDRVGFRRVSFDSIVFWIHVATSHTRVGSVNHGLVEDRLFELSG